MKAVLGLASALLATWIVFVSSSGVVRRHHSTTAVRAAADGGVVDSGTPLPVQLTQASLVDNMELWLHAHATQHMWVEDTVVGAVTHPASDGDAVGTIDDPSNSAHLIEALTATRKPVLATVSGTSVLDCTGATSNTSDRLQVANSQTAFAHFYDTRRVGTLMCRIAATQADGTAFQIVDSNRGTTANAGIYLARTSANTIQALQTGASTTVCGGTTTAQFTAAMGLDWIVMRENGTQLVLRVGAAGSDQTFACAGAGATLYTAASDPLTFCGTAAGSATNSQRVSDCLIFSTYLSNSDVSAVIAQVNARHADSLLRERPAADGFYNFLSVWYQLTDSATVFEDSGATDAAESTDLVRVVRDPRDPLNLLQRAATATGAAGPFFATTSGLQWDGVADETIAFSNGWRRFGGSTTVIEASNLDTTLGSHVLHGGAYVPMTGSDYASNPAGAAYYLLHATGGSATNTTLLTADGVGFQHLEIVRNGTTFLTSVDGATQVSSTNATSWAPSAIGREANTGWRMHGYQRRVLRYNASLTTAQIARVRAGL